MKHRKKQLLGVFGLLVVMAMTIIAGLVPVGDAAAEGEASFGPQTTIQVTVGSGGEGPDDPDDPNNPGGPGSSVPYVYFDSPQDESTVTSNIVKVSARYRNAKSIRYILQRASEEGTDAGIVVYEASIDEMGYGTSEFDLDMTKYATKFDEGFVLVAEITGENGGIHQDQARFTYRAVFVEMQEDTAKNDDPIIKVQYNQEVAKLVLQVYDKDGKPVFVNQNGTEEPLIFNQEQLDYDKLTMDVVLPMEKYGAKPGDYQLVAVAYNAAGETISMNLTDFRYRPDWIKNPNTGSVLADTNISRMDYILTGLIVFGSVAAFASFLILRKKRQ